MESVKELFQQADWKTEKHVPVIEAQDKAKKQELIKITLTVGKEIAHPNTTEHHIRWIAVFFHPKAEKFPYQIGRFEFTAHGESVQAPNTSTVYTHPAVTCSFKTEKSGTILASSYCNIHGLWEGAKELAVE
ncbi:MAG: class II SORL domain-containing protein [Candidatus Omnitrophica bacterium]|nr:class II SORL domain-containing protein [Candidatus Omnitrophota bacterium]